jgi:hypothetical protein
MPEPSLDDHLGDLSYPESFTGRRPDRTGTAEEVIASFSEQFPSRNFILGLLFAFIGVVEDLLAQAGSEGSSTALQDYPPEQLLPNGRRRNALYVNGPEHGISLRTYYDKAERLILYDLRRYGYPNCAPHATQAWEQHRSDLDKLFAMTPAQRRGVADVLWDAVIALPASPTRSADTATPRPFTVLLTSFENRVGSEPRGAVLQGLAFAYYRADAPNVTLETGKVGAGSARVGRAGDVDGWSGSRLVLSIEVKDYDVNETEVPVLGPFLGNLAEWPDATAIVVAQSFTVGVESALRKLNVLVLDRATMLQNVELWDLRKQQLALREFEYFVARVQRDDRLVRRLEAFVGDNDLVVD